MSHHGFAVNATSVRTIGNFHRISLPVQPSIDPVVEQVKDFL